MTKEFEGYISELPKGCITETDIYTDKGVLLCPKMTVMDENTLEKLSNYKGPVQVVISYTEEPVEEVIIQPDKDESIEFDNSFKEYAVETLSNLYANVDDVDTLTIGATEMGEEVYSIVKSATSLCINLEKLKVSDVYTYKHAVDVGTMAAVLAKVIGESDSFVREVTVSGLLHDIGKEKIPAEIINKPAKLTKEEFEIIKTHPIHGYKLLLGAALISEEVRQGILNHHENVDGTGYPRGLVDDRIGKMAQIISIVDVYDALVTERAYKSAMSPSQAIEIMFTMSNKFNMDYFRAFLSIINAFPNGTEVLLSTGEIAIVMRQNKSYPLRPVIKLRDSEKIINLARDTSYLSTVILRAA